MALTERGDSARNPPHTRLGQHELPPVELGAGPFDAVAEPVQALGDGIAAAATSASTALPAQDDAVCTAIRSGGGSCSSSRANGRPGTCRRYFSPGIHPATSSSNAAASRTVLVTANSHAKPDNAS